MISPTQPPDLPPELIIDEKESRLHRLNSLSILVYTCLLILTVITIWVFKHRRIRYLHETGLALLYGIIVGIIIRYGVSLGEVTTMRVRPYNWHELLNGTLKGPPDVLYLDVVGSHRVMNKTLAYSFKGEAKDIDPVIDDKATFDPEIFFNILLPPIIFHAGYSMKKRFFFRNIGSIFAFAFLGTVISTFAVGGIMYGITKMFYSHFEAYKFTFLDSLHFGSLISATDPVTILAIFNDLHVDVNLYALVFGESVLNDAVAIVLSRTIEDYEESDGDDNLIVLKSLGEFLGIFSASFLVGSLMGCATALLTKFTQLRNFPELESTLFVLMSYSTFLLAEVLNLTGIVAVLFCGICQAHYTYNNLSEESRAITKHFFGLLNFMAENFIFVYIGVSIMTFPKHRFDGIFITGSFIAIAVGRALNIYPLSFLLNLGRKNKISMSFQHMLFLSGLRGAIAFALSIRNTLSEARQMILSTTLLIVIMTVIVNGGSSMSLLTWLGIPLGVDDEENAPLAHPPPPAQYNRAMEGDPIAPGQVKPTKSWMAKLWSGFDTKYMKPLLTHSNPTLMETMPGCCLPLSRFLTSTEQLARHPMMHHHVMQDDEDDDAMFNDSNVEAAAAAQSPNGNRLPVLASPDKENGAFANVVPPHI